MLIPSLIVIENQPPRFVTEKGQEIDDIVISDEVYNSAIYIKYTSNDNNPGIISNSPMIVVQIEAFTGFTNNELPTSFSEDYLLLEDFSSLSSGTRDHIFTEVYNPSNNIFGIY